MSSDPSTPEVIKPSKSPPLVLQGPQVGRPFSPGSSKSMQIPATTSPGAQDEEQQKTEPQPLSSTEAKPPIPSSPTKIPANSVNVASPGSIRGRAASRRDPASLHSMENRRSSGSSRSSNRSRRSSSSGSGDGLPRKVKFDPMSTIKSEVSLQITPLDENDMEEFPPLALEPHLRAAVTSPKSENASSEHLLPSVITVPVVRPVSPPTQVELDNHVRVFHELDLESMPPRKRSYTRHRYMTEERKIGLAFLAVALPPLAVQMTLRGRCWKQVFLASVLWVLGIVPGVVYAISVVMAPWQSIPESTDRKWMQRREEREENIRRLRCYDTDIDGDDIEKPVRRGWLLRRFKRRSEPPPAGWTMGSLG